MWSKDVLVILDLVSLASGNDLLPNSITPIINLDIMPYLAFNYDDNDNYLIAMNYADIIQDGKNSRTDWMPNKPGMMYIGPRYHTMHRLSTY